MATLVLTAVGSAIGGPIGVGVAELLAAAGHQVHIATPDQIIGNELARAGDLGPANARLAQAGVELHRRSILRVVDGDGATFYGRMDRASADALLDERVLGKGGAALCRHRLPPENLLDVSALAEDEDGRGAEADAAEEDQGDQGEAT